MPQNYIPCDRDQELLLPPNLKDWLPDDHLAWFVLEAVEELDLAGRMSRPSWNFDGGPELTIRP